MDKSEDSNTEQKMLNMSTNDQLENIRKRIMANNDRNDCMKGVLTTYTIDPNKT